MGGLCAVSQVPLSVQGEDEWPVSIERLSNDEGYVARNVVLICSEFQSSDLSRLATTKVLGSPQWSKDKGDRFMMALQAPEVREWIVQRFVIFHRLPSPFSSVL